MPVISFSWRQLVLTALFVVHNSACTGSTTVFALALFGTVNGHLGRPSSISTSAKAAAASNLDTQNETPSATSELPSDFPRTDDVLVALDAVRKACQVTQSLQPLQGQTGSSNAATNNNDNNSITTVEKADLSPVTVADYAVQALVLHTIHQQFAQDGFIAEESSDALRESDVLCQSVVAASTLSQEDTLAGIDLGRSFTQWEELAVLSKNNKEEDASKLQRPKRVWCLDPIDGTKGFLRGKHTGGQYCIALSLIEDGVPVIGILGCPNLPVKDDDSDSDNDKQPYGAWSEEEIQGGRSNHRGCIFVASRGGGCYQLPLVAPDSTKSDDTMTPSTRGPLQVTPNNPSSSSSRPVNQGRFCIGVEKFSDALGQTDAMADILQEGGLLRTDDETAGTIRYAKRMDSQAKHGVISRGGAEWYVRLPKPGYQEYIWDHAAGFVVVSEAGGTMTDTKGQALDFSLGHQLDVSVRGILMSNGGEFHGALVDSLAQVQQRQQK